VVIRTGYTVVRGSETRLVLSDGPVQPISIYWSTERLIEFAALTSRRISIRDAVGQYITPCATKRRYGSQECSVHAG
jgi:hypothetical protein